MGHCRDATDWYLVVWAKEVCMTINTNEIAPSTANDPATEPISRPELTYGRGYPMSDVGRRTLGELAYASSGSSHIPHDFMTELQMPRRVGNRAARLGRAATKIQVR